MSSYDQNLLDEAPRATRAQLQQGYNVDLLEQPPRRTPSHRNPPPQIPQTVPLTENGSAEKSNSSLAPKPRTSFWRTRNGIITITILVLIVTGAVVGGAVGGTVKKSSSSNNVATTGTSPTPTTGTPAASGASQGTGGQSTQGIGGGGGTITSRPAGFTATPGNTI